MARVIRSFAGAPGVRLTVVCGANPGRVEQARRAAAQAGVAAEVVGFEEDMPRRMAEAHVVVGKPGGLTVSESLAAGRPMALVGACPGQETLNQAWMVENGAAVAADPDEVGRVVTALGPRRRLKLAASARSIAAPDAADRVVSVALRQIERLKIPRAA
jgi:processive 1,2-diacylglycerol beta-glucosyltransferase